MDWSILKNRRNKSGEFTLYKVLKVNWKKFLRLFIKSSLPGQIAEKTQSVLSYYCYCSVRALGLTIPKGWSLRGLRHSLTQPTSGTLQSGFTYYSEHHPEASSVT